MEVIDNVIQAYEAVKMNDVSKGVIALCSFIAIIIVIQKFVTAWKEAFSEGEKPADMKQFFRLFYIYIYVFGIIMAAPFAFTIVETALGAIQDELIERYQSDVDLSIDEAIMTFTRDYIEDVQRRHNWSGSRFRRCDPAYQYCGLYRAAVCHEVHLLLFRSGKVLVPYPAGDCYSDSDNPLSGREDKALHPCLFEEPFRVLHDNSGVPDSQCDGRHHFRECHAHVRTEQIHHAGAAVRLCVQAVPVCQKREILS